MGERSIFAHRILSGTCIALEVHISTLQAYDYACSYCLQLYVTPGSNGIPIREVGCVQSEYVYHHTTLAVRYSLIDCQSYTNRDYGHYAYVTDFNAYNASVPDYQQYFALPPTCTILGSDASIDTSSWSASITAMDPQQQPQPHQQQQSARSKRDRRVANAARFASSSYTNGNGNDPRTQASCSSYSYSSLCSTLIQRIDDATPDDYTSSSSSSGGAIGGVIGAVIGIAIIAFIITRWRQNCNNDGYYDTSPIEMEVVPIVTFQVCALHHTFAIECRLNRLILID
jgi:hypothetical protein